MRLIITLFVLIWSAGSTLGQWNTNTLVNLEVSGLEATDIQSAATSDGKTWVAFYSNSGSNYDMRAQLLDAGGNKLLGSDGLVVSAQPSGSATFVFNICVDGNNALIIAFQYEVAGILNTVVTKVNTDGTLPWGAGVILGAGLAPNAAVTKTNDVLVAWSNNSPSTLYMQKISSAGALLWAAPVAVTVGTSNTTRGQIVVNENGFFTLIFQRRSFGISTTLYAQRYDASGVAQWASPVQLCNQTTSGARYYSVLAVGNTSYCGYYASGGSRFFSYLQRINADGTLPWGINGSPFSTYSTGADPMPQTTGIAYQTGTAHVWAVSTYSDVAQTQYGVYVQKFDTTSGAVLLDPQGKTVYPVSASFDTYAGQLSLVNDNPIFISYDVNYKIYATRLNSSGDFVWPGNRVELSSTTTSLGNPKGRFCFTEVVNDQAVAVWQENRTGTDKAYAQNISASGTLPVSLLTFGGRAQQGDNLLFWTTASEAGASGFDIERSSDGRRFAKVGWIGSRALSGNSSQPLSYQYTDKYGNRETFFYRLKQVDLNGGYRYSSTVRIAANPIGETSWQVFPNPGTDYLMVSPSAGAGVLRIMDPIGRTLALYPVPETSQPVQINTSLLPSGEYVMEYVAKSGVVLRSRWVKR